MKTPDQSLPNTRTASREKRLPVELFLRFLLGGVAFAAGLTGLLLIVFPGSTARYFSWGLDPEPLASLIGGSYLASTFIFGFALQRKWSEVRGLVAGTLALTLPILAVTFLHLDVFDFGRWQAWAWILLFIASPVSFGSVLFLRRRWGCGGGPRVAYWARGVAAVLALGFLTAATALWWDPSIVSAAIPFVLPPLGGRILGCWNSFLAFLAIWSAARGTWDEARIPLLGLAAFTAGALGGAVRNLNVLQPSTQRVGYLVVLVALLVVTTLLAVRGRAVSD